MFSRIICIFSDMEQNLIGRYNVIQKVGEGGMAEVFLAQHKDVPTLRVILKKLKNSQQKEDFVKEASNLARLNHNHICTIIDFATIDGVNYIVMKPIDGPSLKDVIKLKRSLPIDQSLKITLAMLGALNYAHGKKIYHRDIKPSNVMLNQQGEAVLIDFGIAKNEDDPEQTQEGIFRGTPHFAAPEQFSAKRGTDFNWCSVDIYAVGLTLYNMLTGFTPFTGASLGEIALEKVSVDPDPPSKHNPLVSKQLDEVVLKSICRSPERRYLSSVEMTNALIESANEIPQKDIASGDFTVTVHSDYFEEVERKRKSERKTWLRSLPIKIAAVVVMLGSSGLFLLPPMLNSTPQLNSIEPIEAFVGEELHFTIVASDADGDTLRLLANDLPRGAFFSDNGDNSGEFSWIPSESQDGNYAPEISALDNFDSVGILVSISVTKRGSKSSIVNDTSGEDVFDTRSEIVSENQDPGVSNTVEVKTVDSAGESKAATTTNGFVRVRISPYGRIDFDGKTVASKIDDTLLAVPFGEHTLRAFNADSKEGSIAKSVSVGTGDTSVSTFTFTRVSTKGRIVVSSIPRGGRVFVNNELQAEVAPFTFSLTPGVYSVRVESPSGKQSSDTTIIVKADTDNSFVVRFAPE